MDFEMPCSIVIPTKDRPSSLVGAVRSAIAALPAGGEIIVVDDNGKIPAAETLADFLAGPVRVIRNPGPNGPSQARNFGVSQASGRIVFFLDDDDELLPDYCRRVLSTAHLRPENCAYGHCAALHMELDGPPSYHGKKQAAGVHGDEAPLGDRLAGLGMGFWIERAVFLDAGGIDPALRVNEDTEFCIRLASLGYCSFYDRKAGVLLRQDRTRTKGDQASITKAASAMERARGFEYILHKHVDYLKDHPRFRRLFLSRVIKYRSRARKSEGFVDFARKVRPALDMLLLLSLGSALLRLSIAVRRLK